MASTRQGWIYETHQASKLVFAVQWAVQGAGGCRGETRYTGRKAVFLQLVVLVQAAKAKDRSNKDGTWQSMKDGKRMTIRNIGRLRASGGSWGTFAVSNAMDHGQRLVPARKRVISHSPILKKLARHLMHALHLKVPAGREDASRKDGRASSDVTGWQ